MKLFLLTCWFAFASIAVLVEGTGLGRSLSYDIITKGPGGALTVDSMEGDSTEFILRLYSKEHCSPILL